MPSLTHDRGDYTFTFGLLTGTVVGAGLAMWLAPRAYSELRQRVAQSAEMLGQRASARYERASARVDDTMSALTLKSQAVRNDVADAVARGAHEVERVANSAKTDRTAGTR